MAETAADILLDGLYDAKMDGQPVLAITGMPYHDLIGVRRRRRLFDAHGGVRQRRHVQAPDQGFIVKNNSLGMIKWEQMVFLGNPEYGCDLQPIDLAAYAHACGATGFTVEDPAECGEVVEQALNTPGPVIVEAIVDPFTPPMPPKITVEQATHFAQSLVRGQPNREKIAWTVLSDRVRELV